MVVETGKDFEWYGFPIKVYVVVAFNIIRIEFRTGKVFAYHDSVGQMKNLMLYCLSLNGRADKAP
jgi:hypothetical protein